MPFDPLLVSVGQVREACGVRGNGEDRYLGEIAQAATDLANGLTDRKLKLRTYASDADGGDEAAEVLSGTGSYRLRLAQSPVVAVTKVELLRADVPETWEELDTATYPITIDASVPGLIFLRNGSFPWGFRNVRVSYSAGYAAPIPYDLSIAVRALALALYKLKDKQLAGVVSKSFEGQTIVYDQRAIPDAVVVLFNKFVRKEFV